MDDEILGQGRDATRVDDDTRSPCPKRGRAGEATVTVGGTGSCCPIDQPARSIPDVPPEGNWTDGILRFARSLTGVHHFLLLVATFRCSDGSSNVRICVLLSISTVSSSVCTTSGLERSQ